MLIINGAVTLCRFDRIRPRYIRSSTDVNGISVALFGRRPNVKLVTGWSYSVVIARCLGRTVSDRLNRVRWVGARPKKSVLVE